MPTSSRVPRGASATTVAGIAITHPDRILYPAATITKLEMVRYYDAVADRMLPHLTGRPLTLKQCAPDVDQCRFLRHSGERAPASVRVVQIQEQTKVGDYMIVDDRAALIALAQRNMVEFHTWNATVADIEKPNRLVIDLDPGPKVSWGAVVRAAQLVRRTLRTAALESWVKTTGGRGLHVVVPIVPTLEWSTCLAFARALAEHVAAEDPSQFTTAFRKIGRDDRILVDYLRNNRTNTIVSAYSLRARTEATVSMPLAWDELTVRRPPERWTMKATLRRLRDDDPWKAYDASAQRVDRSIRALSSEWSKSHRASTRAPKGAP